MYESTDPQGKMRKMPTSRGQELGIFTERKMGRDGEYIAILFGERAQHFLIDNIQGILAK